MAAKAKKKKAKPTVTRRQKPDRRDHKRSRGAVRRRHEMTEIPADNHPKPHPGSLAFVLGLPKRLYNWVLSFADSPNSEKALFGLSFAESSFFPVPPDILLMPLVLGRPNKWLKFAFYCTLASVLGGMAGFGIGYSVWSGIAETVFSFNLPSVSLHNFDKVAALFAEHSMWFILIAAFTPVPYKVITITAGSMAVSPEISVLPFFTMSVAVSIVGRGARFYLVAAMCKRWGPPILPLIDRYFGWLTLVFTIMLFAGFYILKFLH